LFNNFLLYLIKQNKNAKEAVEVCSEALAIHPNDVNVLCDRAEAYLLNDNLDNGNCTTTQK
jgi:PREDICTED: similar to dnaJ (hsp40) homolog, subfamily C, member 3